MLVEPIVESAPWLDRTAATTCTPINGRSCDWYHRSWQYLRLLGLVSNPSWHTDFFVDELRRAFPGQERVDVLVSGCADYSMFAHVAYALDERARCTALDWCPTPLLATCWYARRVGVQEPRTLCEDAVRHAPADAYDAIVTDSFLPRFPETELAALVRAWCRSLRPGGLALTTVRLHEGTAGNDRRPAAVADEWRRRARAAAGWWPAEARLSVDELAQRAAFFARNQERNAFYDLDRIERFFEDAGFATVQAVVVDVSGKRFARLVATTKPDRQTNEGGRR